MKKDMKNTLIRAMNNIEKAKKEIIDFSTTQPQPVLEKTYRRLETAIRQLNKMCAFYKVQ